MKCIRLTIVFILFLASFDTRIAFGKSCADLFVQPTSASIMRGWLAGAARGLANRATHLWGPRRTKPQVAQPEPEPVKRPDRYSDAERNSKEWWFNQYRDYLDLCLELQRRFKEARPTEEDFQNHRLGPDSAEKRRELSERLGRIEESVDQPSKSLATGVEWVGFEAEDRARASFIRDGSAILRILLQSNYPELHAQLLLEEKESPRLHVQHLHNFEVIMDRLDLRSAFIDQFAPHRIQYLESRMFEWRTAASGISSRTGERRPDARVWERRVEDAERELEALKREIEENPEWYVVPWILEVDKWPWDPPPGD